MEGNDSRRNRTWRCRSGGVLLATAAMVVLAGAGIGVAAQKPILTKSGKKAALQDAAARVLQITPMAPLNPVDETKVPHYFGPYPNWANSPLTLPDAQVLITGDGSGATAVATVGAGGAITAITVTDPGRNYSNAKVDIVGSGTGATADATIVKKGAVVAVTVDAPGAGYTAPAVTFGGGGGGSGAAATAYGGVDVVTIGNVGFGYSFPTVDFDLPDGPEGTQARGHAVCVEVNCVPVAPATTVTITGVAVDYPGSGYSTAPGVVIRDGTIADPINHAPGDFNQETATATLSIQSIVVDAPGTGYTQPPTVAIADLTGTGANAAATALLDNGVISAITIKKPGSGYVTPGGLRKFVDTLPGLGPAGANNLGQYLPVAVPDQTTFPGTDYYVIAVIQHREKMHSDLPPTLMRAYVQLSTPVTPGKQVALQTDLKAGGTTAALMPDGSQAYGVDDPHFLGPVIVAQKDRAVRIVFYNLLPKGSEGDLFLPTDSTIMGSGVTPGFTGAMTDLGLVTDSVRNPMCTEYPKNGTDCFLDNRATLHLHGGITPWISDGTPHQWITPATESTGWPQGVSVGVVPDMNVPGVPDCSAPNDGCQTFYYSNQQSARLMFYHDHAWGITRLNVYAGEAAGYLIQDPVEQALVSGGILPADQIPLVIQDRTFVPSMQQLAAQDPTWDAARWGGYGNFWYHHVYMPAQNPGDPGGMSAYGRWMYGPWFWPPAINAIYGPIANPYYNMDPATGFTTPLAVPCSLDDPTTWQYQTDPFCEPQLIPGTPNISAGMEQFNDTPIVNGTAYPTLTLSPKSYRLRILSAANDRFWNLQWYVADATGTEVALNAAELAAAQTDPVVFPTPDTTLSPAGPSWIQLGTEGGFLPAPVVIPNQPITWITDPTRFDVGNVDKHSLLLAPAERADVVVDFSQFAGKTLILYNDAPAAFPARVSSYDYYTGGPDLSPVGAPTILPGYGPNTRTIMQVKIAASAPAPAFNLAALNAAFRHHANGSGVFESGQHPIIVGQAGYNSAYGTSFAASGWCNSPTSTIKCDGLARISQQGGDPFTFDTLRMNPNGTYPAGYGKLSIPLQPKAIHDEMNSSSFDEFGRMQANLGVEAVPANPAAQNVTLIPYTGSPTEVIDATKLPTGDMKVTPIAAADDGTQIWKITHNGVDTHPIHFHLYDVQLLNRVTWDNIIIAPDANELGWKDTVRVSPLEDTIVALRPIVPKLPFDLPNSVHELSPMMPDGVELFPGLLADPQGNPLAVFNHLVNFGWEYVYHCHILSHEEMDMMRPVLLAVPPVTPSGLTFDGVNLLSWTDNSLSETAFVGEKSIDGGATWAQFGRVDRILGAQNTVGDLVTLVDGTPAAGDLYRVFAENTVGDTATPGFPVVTTKSAYAYIGAPAPAAAPTNLTAALQAGPQVGLTWTDNANNETGFLVERSDNGGAFAVLATAPALAGLGVVTYVDLTVLPGNSYTYRVAATSLAGPSAYSNTASVSVPATPAPPTGLNAALQAGPQVGLSWTDNATNETGFRVERSVNGGAFALLTTLPALAGTGAVTYVDAAVSAGNTYTYQVAATNLSGSSAYSNTASASLPALPGKPVISSLTAVRRNNNAERVTVAWGDVAGETSYTVQWSAAQDFGVVAGSSAPLAVNTTLWTTGNIAKILWWFRVGAVNGAGTVWSDPVSVAAAP